MLRFVGLDVHKKMVQVCVLDPQGKVLLEKQILKEGMNGR